MFLTRTLNILTLSIVHIGEENSCHLKPANLNERKFKTQNIISCCYRGTQMWIILARDSSSILKLFIIPQFVLEYIRHHAPYLWDTLIYLHLGWLYILTLCLCCWTLYVNNMMFQSRRVHVYIVCRNNCCNSIQRNFSVHVYT